MIPIIVVYNARKRGEDRASDYFKRTENVAGVKDMRFQALMPDILHWLGIQKIDRMLSMSKYVLLGYSRSCLRSLGYGEWLTFLVSCSMKHDAIVGQG